MYRYKGENSVFVKRVKLLMQENNTDLDELAKILNLSVIECDKMLRGKEPSYEVFIYLALHYKVSCDFIIGLSNDRARKKRIRKKD